jgi:hypothetical protein
MASSPTGESRPERRRWTRLVLALGLSLGLLASRRSAPWLVAAAPWLRPDGHALVRVACAPGDAEALAADGFDVASGDRGRWLEIVADAAAMARLEARGLHPVVIDPDLEGTSHRSRLAAEDNSPLGAYTTYQELTDRLQALRAHYPQIVGEPISIGESLDGRKIWAIALSGAGAAAGQPSGPVPEMLYTGCHHARELISVEIPLGILQHLVESYGHDAGLTDLVDHTRLWFVPMLNPDGHVWVEQGHTLWRKNRRGPVPDSAASAVFGVDLNRNYASHWAYDSRGSSASPTSDIYRGAAPFSEPETAALRDFVQAHAFRYAISFHSYGRKYIYPWSYRRLPGADEATYRAIAELMARGNGYDTGTVIQTLGYLANGTSDDWLYARQAGGQKTFAFTAEVGTAFAPPDSAIAGLVEENMGPALLLAQLTRASGAVEVFVHPGTTGARAGQDWSGTLLLANRTSEPQQVRVWTSVEDPADQPLPGDPSQAAPAEFLLPPFANTAIVAPFRISLPSSTRPGSYRFNATVGRSYPFPVLSAARAPLVVSAP